MSLAGQGAAGGWMQQVLGDNVVAFSSGVQRKGVASHPRKGPPPLPTSHEGTAQVPSAGVENCLPRVDFAVALPCWLIQKSLQQGSTCTQRPSVSCCVRRGISTTPCTGTLVCGVIYYLHPEVESSWVGEGELSTRRACAQLRGCLLFVSVHST